jgi:hypothetical protein
MGLPEKLDDLGFLLYIYTHSMQSTLPNRCNLALPWSEQHHCHHGDGLAAE